MKVCTRPVFLPWPFLDLFCKVTKTWNFFQIIPWTWGHHNSLNRLTLTFDHGFNSYLGWWSCAQDLLTFLQVHKKLQIFPHCIMNGGGGTLWTPQLIKSFDIDLWSCMTLCLFYLMEKWFPGDGRYCNAPRPSVHPSVRLSVCLSVCLSVHHV